MTQSSGFLTDWNKETRKGIVLTSAHIICSKYTSEWSGANEYSPNAKVRNMAMLINYNFARCIPRLHFGMKFSPIKFLDPIHVERIFRKCNVDSGLIVKEVSVVHCFLLSYTLYAFFIINIE